jgi:alkylation response protein AidB-like acyl-CoA dehydrogenase
VRDVDGTAVEAVRGRVASSLERSVAGGKIDAGEREAIGRLERTRLGAAAQAVGIAQGATDYANSYAKERVAFGGPINQLQGIGFKLADMETGTAAARELLYKA